MAPANLKAQKRTIIGKKTKSLRKQGSIPGVVYGHGIKSMPITINDKEFGNCNMINFRVHINYEKSINLDEKDVSDDDYVDLLKIFSK